MQGAEARMERQLAAGMDLDALYGISSRELAGMELGGNEESRDEEEEDALEGAAGADAELDAPPGMRLDTLGGSDDGGELGSSQRPFSSGRADDDTAPEGFTSSKEARGCSPAILSVHAAVHM